MEASTLQQAPALAKPRLAVGAPLLRFRSDEQLVALFRDGHEDAFRAIHDRYHKRLFAYARQMLPARQDAEDALQDVFVRAYSGLRASHRDLALRAWLFRVAHNRCIDELRKPTPPAPEVLDLLRTAVHDPVAELDRRESLRRLVQDIRRLPHQQRSALLMRELGGMSYAELATSLGISVGAVKSVLVRARLALAQASEARETACAVIREQLIEAHDRGARPNANARKHMRDCSACKSFRGELRGVSRQLAAVAPTLGPLGFLAQLLGLSGGGSAAGGAGGGAALLSGGGATASVGGAALSGSHLTALIVAAVATAGGAVEIQRNILRQPRHVVHASVSRAKPRQSSPALAAMGAGVTSAAKVSHAITAPAADRPVLAPRSAASPGVANRRSLASVGIVKKRLHRSPSTTSTIVQPSAGSIPTACATPDASNSGGSATSISGGGSATTATGGGSAASPAPASPAPASGSLSCGTTVTPSPAPSPVPDQQPTSTNDPTGPDSPTGTGSQTPPAQGTVSSSSGTGSDATTG